MNIFRLIGDLLHLLSFFLLIQKILKKKSCQELSYRTQEIFLIVFCTRYLDLFMYFVSLYNTLMKVGYIGCTSYIIYLMRFKKPYCTVSPRPFIHAFGAELQQRKRQLQPSVVFIPSCDGDHYHLSFDKRVPSDFRASLVFLNLARGSGDCPTNLHRLPFERSRNDYRKLHGQSWALQILLHPQLVGLKLL